MNECGEIAGRNMSSYVNESSEEKPEVPTYLTKIIEYLCPNDCTFNGRCVNVMDRVFAMTGLLPRIAR